MSDSARWWKLIFPALSIHQHTTSDGGDVGGSSSSPSSSTTSPQSPAAATVQLIAVGARGKVIGQQAANSGGKPYHESVVVCFVGDVL